MGADVEQLAAFVAKATAADIPAAVQHHAKLTILDTLGVILAGSQRPEVRAIRGKMATGSGATAYGADWPTCAPQTAAMLNGIAGRSIELCEGLRLTSGQVAVQILPSLLAIGEAGQHTGQDLLTAFILGYDVAARLSLAFTPWPLAHQNGQFCLIAAAAAGAKLMGMDANGISLAMRIAAPLVLTPSYTHVVAGATALNVAGGMAGFAGVLGPDLAMAGFTALDDALETSLGNLTGQGFAAERLTTDLGTVWHITRNYFRLYACCNPIHPALDALSAVLTDLRPSPEQIERIDIATYRFAAVMRNADPPNYFASKYALPHAAAVMAVTGRADHAALDDAALTNPVVAALRHRVTITEDATMTAKVPALRPARVTVVLKNGQSATRSVDSHRGDFNQPYTEAELRDKFHALATEVVSTAGARALEAAVDALQNRQTVADLPDLMRAHGRI